VSPIVERAGCAREVAVFVRCDVRAAFEAERLATPFLVAAFARVGDDFFAMQVS
jgi:hypothetical protein